METTNFPTTTETTTAVARLSVSTALAPISADLNDLAKVINQPPAQVALRVAKDFAKIEEETGIAVSELVEQALALSPAHRLVALDHLSFGATPAAIGVILSEVAPRLEDPTQVDRELTAYRQKLRDAGQQVPEALEEYHDHLVEKARSRYKSAGAKLSDVLNLMQSESDEGRMLVGADTEPVIAPEELAKVLARLILRFGTVPSTGAVIQEGSDGKPKKLSEGVTGDREGLTPYLSEAYSRVGELAELFDIPLPDAEEDVNGWAKAIHEIMVAFVLLLDRVATEGSTLFDPRSVEDVIDQAAQYAKAEEITGKMLFDNFAREDEEFEDSDEEFLDKFFEEKGV
jgi:hypothetical protein